MPVADATAYYDGSGTGFVTAQDGKDAVTQMYTDMNTWRQLPIAVGNTFIPGQHFTTQSFRLTANECIVGPFWLPSAMTISSATFYIYTASSAGQTQRIAFYSHHASGWKPGTLIADIGTISSATTGAKTISSLSVTLDKGWNWIAAGAVSTVATAGTAYGSLASFGGSHPSATAAALPGGLTYTGWNSAAAPNDFSSATLSAVSAFCISCEMVRSA